MGDSLPKDDLPQSASPAGGARVYNLTQQHTQYVQNEQTYDMEALAAQGLATAREFADRAEMQARG